MERWKGKKEIETVMSLSHVLQRQTGSQNKAKLHVAREKKKMLWKDQASRAVHRWILQKMWGGSHINLHNLFQKRAEGTLFDSLYEVLTTNVLESTQQEKKSTDQTSHEYKCKTLNNILADQTQQCTQRLQSKSDLSPIGKVGSTSETQLIFTSTG